MIERCPDCGVELAAVDTATHAYFGASASCWALYGSVLAREYGDPAFFRAHRMTVDAYAAQHPGRAERRTVRSVNLHLAGLYLTVERRSSDRHTLRVIRTLASRDASAFAWPEPPGSLGDVRVDEVAAAQDAEDHLRRVEAWARSVWRAWADHHAQVAALVASVDR